MASSRTPATGPRTPSPSNAESSGLTYAELDARANQITHRLRGLGLGSDSSVALLLPRPVEMYASLLGVCKAGAAFVPVDPAAPVDRVDFILRDAGVDALLTISALASGAPCPVIEIDGCVEEWTLLPSTRPPEDAERCGPSGVHHVHLGLERQARGGGDRPVQLRNFLRVVGPVYDMRPGDRVYLDMTISFDFSIEEIWPTWAAGATVVAGPTDSARLGAGLADFLDPREAQP
ncbi:AMP-binding protein [Streptomyces sp. NPDC004232]|uniref:AMP-binding protein n=1 Tax=Streptomyces sp. NPDC004232 TaxID=3154454 RepID=UPI0033B11746